MAFLLFWADETKAQAIKQVHFAKGANSATLSGVLRGQSQRYSDYIVRARAGQTMEIKLIGETKAEFVIFQPKSLENLNFGSKEWSGELPQTGAYIVRVILNRNFARRAVKTAYKVHISVH